MAGSERLRLFCALQLPDETVERLVRWQAELLQPQLLPPQLLQPRVRLVARENLHVTLAFLGSRPAGDLPAIEAVLEAAAGLAQDIRLVVRGYRETRTVGMLTFDDEGGRATALADRLGTDLEAAGVYRREARAWLPHVTVLRFREQPRLDPALPELGEVSPSDVAVYSSVLRSGGARYVVLKNVTLLSTEYGLGG